MPYVIGVTSSILAAVILAISIAGVRAARMAFGKGKGSTQNGPWMTRFTFGSEKMSWHERAFLSIAGLWALKSSEVVYFTAFRDSEGQRLSFQHQYRIEGCELESRWWTITVYRNFHFISNESKRYSFSKTSIQLKEDDTWTINLSQQPQVENWLPIGDQRGILAISLRLYNPSQMVYDEPGSITLPRIVRDD